MYIYCAIDGTSNNDTSAVAGSCHPVEDTLKGPKSHVKRMTMLGFDAVRYFPGTTDVKTGASSRKIITDAWDWIMARRAEGGADSKIFLGGFSRGAAACLVLAHNFQIENIDVQEMYLFDAVDRAVSMEDGFTAVVPGNVTRAFHALRDPRGRSRQSFGNCGTMGTNGNLETHNFLTTHGGIGGWPNGQKGVESFSMGTGTVGVATDSKGAVMPNIHETAEPRSTRLTVAQEAKGMGETWRWMYSKGLTTDRMAA